MKSRITMWTSWQRIIFCTMALCIILLSFSLASMNTNKSVPHEPSDNSQLEETVKSLQESVTSLELSVRSLEARSRELVKYEDISGMMANITELVEVIRYVLENRQPVY